MDLNDILSDTKSNVQTVSFASTEIVKPKLTGRKLMIKSQQIDKFTTKRSRVVLTPSMCTVAGCGFDAATVNGFGGWRYVKPEKQEVVLDILREHCEQLHNKSEEFIIDESDAPTQWFGSKAAAMAAEVAEDQNFTDGW